MCSLKKLAKRIGVLLCALALLGSLGSAMAEEEAQGRLIRVPMYELEGLCMKDGSGGWYGVIPDYLDAISSYTGWRYEFTECTEDNQMLEDFAAGKYDLCCAAYYLPVLESSYAYPDYNMGYGIAALVARADDASVSSYDRNSLNGKTIGVYKNARESIRRLECYLEMNDLDCVIKNYEFAELDVDGGLYSYLFAGDVDLVLDSSMSYPEGTRAVEGFESQPYYIVTTPDKQDILQELNMALGKLYEANPEFFTTSRDKYFSFQENPAPALTEAEKEFIAGCGTVRVGVLREFSPVVETDHETGEQIGILPDVLALITEFSGLEFEYVYADSYEQLISDIKSGKTDLIGAFSGDRAEANANSLARTQPYCKMGNILLFNKSVKYPGEGLKAALIGGAALPENVKAEEIIHCSSAKEAMRLADSGKADLVYGFPANLTKEMVENYYRNLVPYTADAGYQQLCFAMNKPADEMLFTIIEKSISTVDSGEIEAILTKNSILVTTAGISIGDLLYSNPVLFTAVCAAVLLLIAAVVALVAWLRFRELKVKNELQKAEAKNAAKSEFLSRMSHEVRTPINAVVGLCDVMGTIDAVPPEVGENIEKIRSSSRYLQSLIGDILEMSRIDQGKIELNTESVSIEELVSGIYDMIKTTADSAGLDFSVEKAVSHQWVRTDAVRLRQVLTNLLSNAVKFTPSGGSVRLTVRELQSGENSATYRFSVRDTGVGIAPGDTERIFESFEQAGDYDSRRQGTGLGLAISRNIVELMGGKLKVSSEPGAGSEFYFEIELPYGQALSAEGEENEGEILSGVSILIVEDNEMNTAIAKTLLEHKGARIITAGDGKKGVDEFNNSEPGSIDVILMDIQMPVMNGLEATRAIRALDRADAKSVIIIAMTANSFQNDVDEALGSGMNDFIAKPVDVNTMYKIIRTALRDR